MKLKSDSSAGKPEASADVSLDGIGNGAHDNVEPIRKARSHQSVEDVVRAYFDSIVMQPIPDELDALVRRLG
ncbi:hypothetical protein G6L37_01925 [Agrobacterium rubi]|nr:hypothetical protein [Agrobacterium rubi]NTF24151.1 hypothetical protein [Agrobacterium rubi]